MSHLFILFVLYARNSLKEDRGSVSVMTMLVSILGLWANKNTFINRNDTSGEMLDSLDARDISLRLEDQGEREVYSVEHCMIV